MQYTWNDTIQMCWDEDRGAMRIYFLVVRYVSDVIIPKEGKMWEKLFLLHNDLLVRSKNETKGNENFTHGEGKKRV